MTAAVILNYNDAYATLDAVKRIKGYNSVDRIIVVDNASTDDSAAVLKENIEELAKEGAGVTLLKAGENGGYGRGNNIGVRYAYRHYGAAYCIIANPDAHFSEDIVIKMQGILDGDPGAAVVGAVMKNGAEFSKMPQDSFFSYNEYKLSGWKERGLAGELINSAPVLKRLFGGLINYSRDYYGSAGGAVEVYAVHGSFLMVRTESFIRAGGFDRDIFLYMEETVFARRMKRLGLSTYLLKEPYWHEGSHSVTGAGFDAVNRQRIRQQSELIYYKKYLHSGPAGTMLAKAVQTAVMAETRLLYTARRLLKIN